MKRWTPLLLLLVATALSLSCSHGTNGALNKDETDKSAGQRDNTIKKHPDSTDVVIDNVKVHKDPKGGWFGPKLRDVYMHGEDTPVLFCDSGPSFPTGKEVTIFYYEVMSKPDSSACKAAVAVIDGYGGSWYQGKAVTPAERASMIEQEESFVPEIFAPPFTQMEVGWLKAKPIGDPCPDTSGIPDAVRHRYKGQSCSVVVAYSSGYTLFLNWKVVGLHAPLGAALARDVIQSISAERGSKYVVYKAD